MKRLFIGFLCIGFLLLCGCGVQSSCESTIHAYLSAIESGDYALAYSYLSASTCNDTDTPRANRISGTEFVNRYTNIFKALEITDVLYSDLSIEPGEIIATAKYNMTYFSKKAGEMTNSFRLTAVRENGRWAIEWSPALIFPDMQWGDTVRVSTLRAKRGEILAGSEALAATVGTISVYAMPSKIQNQPLFVSQVARLLNVSEEKLQKSLKAAYNDVAILKTFYSDELAESTKEQLLSIAGIGIDYGNFGTQREYPYKDALAHVIGYVGSASEEQVEEYNEGRNPEDGLYTVDSIVGKLGLERQYERELRGKDGEMIFIATPDGTNRRTLYKRDKQDGCDIQLTIDLDLQLRAEELLKLILYGDNTAGAVVVMNPLTGDIQAAASYPSYDLNAFTRGISAEDYNALLNQPNKPLINRVTQGQYPPGSILKAFTAAAALENGTLTPDFIFTDKIEEDYWLPTQFGTWIWPKIKRAHIKYRTEPLNMHNAIINSDNIYFAYAALSMGTEQFSSYMQKLGFGERLPFDINVASSQIKNKNTEFTPKLLADSGYGQGEVLVTPLQLAVTFGAFANGGSILQPRIVKGIYIEDGIRYKCVSETEPARVWKERVISRESIDTILPMLEHVVDRNYNGTGRNLRVRNCTVAAKTGTAEIGNDKSREISWFIGFRVGVEEKDQRLVMVMLEVPATEEYSSLKFDIARELLEMKEE